MFVCCLVVSVVVLELCIILHRAADTHVFCSLPLPPVMYWEWLFLCRWILFSMFLGKGATVVCDWVASTLVWILNSVSGLMLGWGLHVRLAQTRGALRLFRFHFMVYFITIVSFHSLTKQLG